MNNPDLNQALDTIHTGGGAGSGRGDMTMKAMNTRRYGAAVYALLAAWAIQGTPAARQGAAAPPSVAEFSTLKALGADATIAETDCTAARAGASIPVSAIGERVSAVVLQAPRWVAAAGAVPAYCAVDGSMAPLDTAATARPINFRVLLPAAWNHRAAQIGGGGMNGSIPNLTGADFAIGGRSPLERGFVTYGSDSGHQSAAFGRGAARGDAAAAVTSSDWALNEEAIKNLGYMQMKKTHDAAIAVIARMYGVPPRFTYYVGTSQGGREALTVAQRYPADYNGVVANVPIVGFSSLMLAPELIRIQEKPIANWVTRAKVNAIRGEVMRQCDALDGRVDGLVQNYMACRARFDVAQGAPNRHPWAAKRCPDNTDPDPTDTTANACLTDGQISTLELVYRRYVFTSPLANNVKSFGMWVPNTDPSGSGLIADARFRGQEGAPANAPMHSHLGVLGVTGFLMRDVNANPLDYVEGGPLNARRIELSRILDSTDPDLTPFARRGGRMIVTIGTNDTLASPGAQLDYYESIIQKMGQPAVDRFARLFVIPQVGHGLAGSTYGTDGDGKPVTAAPIPNAYERLPVLIDWVENGKAPAKSLTVAAGDRTAPLCSYPMYPRYQTGPPTAASSYICSR
jgi:feruloyl esterase